MTPVTDHTSRPVGADSTPGTPAELHPNIDRDAPAGSENSLGAESIRDGRPTTKSDVVEAIDEMEPGASDGKPRA